MSQKSEEFILYRYSKHHGGKHTGKNYMSSAEKAIKTAGDLIENDPDTIQIMITDLMDFAVFHWTAEKGMIYPEGITNPILRARPERMK